MNRIKEIRESIGLTQEALAELVGTTGNTISRLELGEQQLTQHWMQVLSQKLGCRPADLISNVVLLELDGEVVEDTDTPPHIAKALAGKGLHIYKVTGRAVYETGIKPGDQITVDQSPEAICAVKGLDVVLVEIGKNRNRVLRQYVPPGKLITNRDGSADIAISLSDPTVSPVIIGVVVRD